MKKYSNIRQSDNWAKYFETFGWKSHRTKNGTNIIYYPTKLGSFVKIQRPPFETKEDLEEIEKFCRSTHALFIKLEPCVDQDKKILEDSGYVISIFPLVPPSSMFIDLTKSGKKLWNDVSRSGKYSVNRAKREGAETVVYKNPAIEILQEYFEIEKYTGKLKKFYVQPLKDLLNRHKIFGEKSYLVLVYDKKENLAGGKYYVADKDTVLYVNGGTSEIGRESKAGYDLMWESILYFKKEGYKTLDLDGVDDERFPNFTKSWGGFSHFKEKFGGEIIRFPYPYIKYLHPFFRFLSKFLTLPL